MAEFRYKAIERSGKTVKGIIAAESKEDAVKKLKAKQLQVDSVRQEFTISLFNSVPLKDLTSFTRQFSTLVGANLPIDESLTILAEQTSNRRLKAAAEDVLKKVRSGVSIGDALNSHPNIFDRLYCGIVKAGESAGVMDQVMLRLADHYERVDKLNRKVRTSLAYPAVVAGIAVAVVTALILFVVPTFKEMFLDMGKELPFATRVVLETSSIVKTVLPFALLLLIVTAIGGRSWARSEKGREVFDTIKQKIPIVGQMLLKSAVARFSRTLATLLNSGIPLIDALRISRASLNNILLERVVDYSIKAVEEGESFSKPLLEGNLFPVLAVRMAAVGERTGKLGNMLSRVADYYEGEVEAAVDTVMSVIEPILILILGIVIGAILISMYLPLFEMATEAR